MSTPFARVTLGDRKPWYWGDGFLKSVELTLSEGSKASNCAISLYDPGRKLIDALLKYLELNEGLEPLEIPQAAPTSTGAIAGAGTASGGLSPNVRAMLDLIAYAEGGDYNILFGGGKFSSFAKHPGGGPAGRYQFQPGTWAEVAAQEGLKDFTPASQDIGAVNRIKSRGAIAALEAGNIESAINSVGSEWRALPQSIDGQSRLTMPEAIAYWNQAKAKYAPATQQNQAVVDSVQKEQPKDSPTRAASLAGQQITIELGIDGQALATYSFLHQSLAFSPFAANTLDLGGIAATWVMSQRVKTTAYKNMNFRQVASLITRSYGLTLKMDIDGPTYVYFPQRGLTDYQALMIEARRIGLRITCVGPTVTIAERKIPNVFTLAYAENLGLEFKVTHQAESGSSGGARSASPGGRASTGQRKTILDPATGEQKAIANENKTGAGESAADFMTGSTMAVNSPLTTGETDEADKARADDESRVKGVLANWSAPTSPEILLLDPDSAISTEGISKQIDRIWVLESITHRLSTDGAESSGAVYSPLRNKYPTPPPPTQTLQGSGLSLVKGELPRSNPGGLIKPVGASVTTSRFGPRGGRLHAGVDLALPAGEAVWAAHDGTVTKPEPDPNGYGSWLIVTGSDGMVTRYAHLSATRAESGQVVKQGQVIALSGGEPGQPGAGSSSGVHLHFEVRPNNSPVDPAQYINV